MIDVVVLSLSSLLVDSTDNVKEHDERFTAERRVAVFL